MDKFEVQLWHAYLMVDGEILICEYTDGERVIWSSSLGNNWVQTKYCKYLEASELGYVGCDCPRDVYLLASGGAVMNNRLIQANVTNKPRLTAYRRSPA